MTKTAASLLILGALILVAGVAAIEWRAGVVLAGLLTIGAGVLSIERQPADTKSGSQ